MEARDVATIRGMAIRHTVGGPTPEAIRDAYCQNGWQADAASWEAVATATTTDQDLIRRVVHHLLEPWLDDSARAFQAALATTPLPGHDQQERITVPEGGCLFFTDGLRYDLAQRLADRLEGRGLRVTVQTRWAALPSVTATGKPAVSPVADAIVGGDLDGSFAPRLRDGDVPADVTHLRKVLEQREYQLLGLGELDVPRTAKARAWIEYGDIDSLGHKLKGRLARQIDEELDRLAERIRQLLASGWTKVRVVTDHGWLLLPLGLPKVELPKFLTESRWARCAVISGESSTEIPLYPWYWNPVESFASPPGIACFKKGEEYAHGGVSIQECLIPDLLVEGGEKACLLSASIESITWRGMRCFVETRVEGKVRADIRLESPTGRSVAAAVKIVQDGAVRLLLSGDEHEEAQLVIVLVDEAGNILAHRSTCVGEQS